MSIGAHTTRPTPSFRVRSGVGVQRHDHGAPVRIEVTPDELAGRDGGKVRLVHLAGVDQLVGRQSLAASEPILDGMACDQIARVLVILLWSHPHHLTV